MSDGKSLTKAFEAVDAFKAKVQGFEKRNDAAVYVRNHFKIAKASYIEILEAKSEAQVSGKDNFSRASIEDVLKAKEEQDNLKWEREARLNTINQVERQIAIGETVNWQAALLEIFWNMDSTVTGTFSKMSK